MSDETKRSKIITSHSADRMLDMVTPIYDESYVALWMYEALGREFDMVRDALDTLPDQLFPESVTWGVELWERRYGIEPDSFLSIEKRRERIIEARDRLHRFSVHRLETWLNEQTGGKARIIDNISSFTFGINIEALYGMASLNVPEAILYINERKPSHLSYGMHFDTTRRAQTYIGLAWYEGGSASIRMAPVDVAALAVNYLYDELDALLMDENGVILED